MNISSTTDVNAAPDAVWALISDVRNWPDLLPDTVTAVTPIDPSRPDEVGAQYRMEQPRIPKGTWQITEWSPPHHFTWSFHSPGVTTTGRHVVEPRPDGGSRVSLGIDWNGPFSAAVRLAYGKLTQRYVDVEGQRLKERAEAS
jgi:hypothetical protein